jgi:hypothetical protein
MSRRSIDRLICDFRGRWKKHINGERVPKHVETWAEFAKLLAERDRNIAARSASPPRRPVWSKNSVDRNVAGIPRSAVCHDIL